MNVLVAYATRHGATAGIAERLAADLRAEGLAVDLVPVTEVRGVARYDAVILGGAAYMFHRLKEATAFARRHRAELQQRPVWLFSSGPLGTEPVDEEGHDVIEASRPKEFSRLSAVLQPRGERVFFGAWDPDAPPIGLGERMLRHMPASRAATPAGDFRDWSAIDVWATEIAISLQPGRAAARPQ